MRASCPSDLYLGRRGRLLLTTVPVEGNGPGYGDGVMPKKQYPCMLCERLFAEIEQAEVCERSHAKEPKK